MYYIIFDCYCNGFRYKSYNAVNLQSTSIEINANNIYINAVNQEMDWTYAT
jgi:hypothetical protein